MSDRTQPLVSVIIPFFNEERFLAEAIESVLSQDYPEWELLLVDDGSTDGSSGIAQDFAARFPDMIRYVTHEGGANRGLPASRNRGIEAARGDLIALLDADDVWLSRKLSSQVAVFQSQPEIAMLMDASEYWYDWETAACENRVRSVGAPQDRGFEPGELMAYLYPLARGTAPTPSAILLRRAVVLELNGFEEGFTRENQLYEDQAFLCKLYLTKKCYISSQCNTRYRQHANSISAMNQGQYHDVRHFFLVWLESYIRERTCDDPHLNKLLTKALLPYRWPLFYRLFYKVPLRVSEVLRSFFPRPRGQIG